jgi:hypothetical protein
MNVLGHHITKLEVLSISSSLSLMAGTAFYAILRLAALSYKRETL